MNIAVGCDEAAYQLKEIVKQHLIEKGYDVTDVGVYNTDPSLYPDTAEKLCKEIIEKRCEKGVLMCGTGIGMAGAIWIAISSGENNQEKKNRFLGNTFVLLATIVRCFAWAQGSLHRKMH